MVQLLVVACRQACFDGGVGGGLATLNGKAEPHDIVVNQSVPASALSLESSTKLILQSQCCLD